MNYLPIVEDKDAVATILLRIFAEASFLMFFQAYVVAHL
jgi:hypothetical protein